MARFSIGVDYGTQSVRAILVDIATGETVAESVSEYEHGILTGFPGVVFPPSCALQDPMDYLNGLIGTVSSVMDRSGIRPENVVGLAIDATASTLLPADGNKQPLSTYPECHLEPHAYLKLWKHHGGEAEAARMTEIASERGEAWLSRYGGRISSEWTFPKVLETLHCAPQVLKKADVLLEVMDWLTWILTDRLTVSGCGRGYKALYTGQYPSDAYLAALDPRLPDIVRMKMNQRVLPVGSVAGHLCGEMAEKLHLLPGTPVGTPIIDAHSSVLGGGITGPGQMMIIMGTSACHLMLTDREALVPGIQGIVRDGIMPGWFGIEAGQSCVGDQFEWAVRNCFPEAYEREAEALGLSPHQLLVRKLEGVHAGDTGLIALDWLNGVRSPLMDFELSGLIVGLNLRTKPEEIYMALVESTAFGTRAILESFENAGLPVREIVLGGGIPAKNPFVVRTFANVLRRPVRICASTQASALGAAMLGIAAAPEAVTSYRNLADITGRLGRVQPGAVQPETAEADTYDRLYADYMELHRYFGRTDPDLMHRLTRLRAGREASV